MLVRSPRMLKAALPLTAPFLLSLGLVSPALSQAQPSFGFVQTDYHAGREPSSVVVADFNHDGKLDMLVEIGHEGSMIRVFLFNNGSQFVSKV